MMTRENACRVCELALWESRRLLQQMVSRPKNVPVSYTVLVYVRNRLDMSCRAFVEQAGDDEHEDIYMPLVDALGLINSALSANEINRNFLALAFERLETLVDLMADEENALTA